MELDTNEPVEPDYQPEPSEVEDAFMEENEEILRQRNMKYYPLVTEIGLRFGLSHTQIAFIINAFLVESGCTDPSEYMSPDKVASMINRLGNYLEQKHMEDPDIKKTMVIGIDAKRSDVLLEKNQTENLDKSTIISMAERKYITHITTEDSKAVTIANEVKTEVIFCKRLM